MSYRKLNAHPLNSLLRSTFARAAAGALGAAAPLAVLANPTGGQVVGGTATIGSAGANGVVITQGSQKAIINWQQFSVGSNEYVQFVQPNSSSVVLNRVIGSNPSNIFGNIIANGQVFLVNANGVYFAPGASVDVQGLVASTLDLNDADFMAGRYVFSKATGASDAGVVNDASIHAGTGGYVVLAGDYAQNGGAIVAQTGRVYLAAGNAATLTFDNNGLISYVVDGKTLSRLAGVSNTGVIAANGGLVVMTADVANTLTATAVNNSGLITAHSVSQQGGEIVLSAQGGGEIENSGTLDATGLNAGVAGGTIIIHGDGHTQLTDTSVIDAEGDGAKGGFIELSGHTLGVRGTVTPGKGGSLLIDPASIDIVAGTANGQSPNSDSIGTTFIVGALNAGSNVTIVASTKIANTTGTGITATAGNGNLTMAIGSVSGPSCAGGAAACVGTGTPIIGHAPGGGTINLTGLPINIKGNLTLDAAGNADSGGVITTAALKANSVELVADTITVNGNITATGGDVSIFAHSGNPSVNINGAITAAGRFVASFSNEGGAGIGTINLQSVTATGIVVVASHINATGTLHANGSGEAAASRDVVLKSQHEFSSVGGAGINVGKIISDHGNVTLSASGNAAAASIGNISAGAITAHENVTITANAGAVGGGNVNVGAISAGTGGVHITASNTGGFHNSLKTGNIIAGDTVTIFYKGGGHDASGGVTVKLGNVDSQRSTSIQASDTSNTPLVVKTGTLTNHAGSANNGQGIQVTLNGADPLFSAAGIVNLAKSGLSCECGAGNINVTLNTTNGSAGKLIATGAIKSTHGNVSLNATNASIDVGSVSGFDVSMNARTIAFGNITAASSVNITANNNHHSSGVNIIDAAANTTISARFITIDMHASYGGNINLGNLTASSANHSAGITVDAQSAQGGNHITVNGNITVNGKGGSAGISSSMPLGGAPVAAYVHMNATGSTEAAHTVKVTGNINVTGRAGTFSGTANMESCGECGLGVHFHGNGGAADVSVFTQGPTGSTQLLGTTTLKGTDAKLVVGSAIIKTGALNVTGSGHTYQVNGTNGTRTFSSHNNVGRASVLLDGSSSRGAPANVIATGNVTISGKGSADLQMDGVSITAGNISVTATKATAVRTLHGASSSNLQHFGLSSNVPGLLGFRMQGAGSFSAGRASVFLGSSNGGPHSNGQPAQSIKTGNISVNGAGEADIHLVGNVIQTGSLNATAVAGKMKGSFSSGGEGGHFRTSFNILGGEADIDVVTGNGTGTGITITGGVAASGPTASVNLFGQTIKVTKGISATGHAGGHVTVTGSGTGGSGFTSSVSAIGPMTGVTLSGVGSVNAASINVGGVVSAKGPGIVGIAITAAKVTLGGLSASASNAAAYKLVNTGDGINDTFTAGSVAVVVFDESGGAVTGPAKINGNVTINAPHGNVALLSQLNVTGQVKITGQNIDTTTSTLIGRISDLNSVTGGGGSGGPNISSIGAVVPKITAAGISMTATAGSIDLTGATLTTPATGALALKATKDIILSGVTINVGTFSANAGSTIHNGGATGTITANGLALTAGKNINLSSTQITVGNGSVASLASDPLLLQALAAAGLSPGTPKPNAYFNAGGTLTLGKLTLTGNYMYMQGANITLLGPVSTPAGSVIQLAPTTGPATIGVEGQPGTGSVLNLSNSLLLSLFPGTTLVIGNGAETGAVTLGSGGAFDIGSSNLIIDTTGTVTGLDNVTSTGLISTVESLLASALAPPTPSEIDPNSTNNNNAAGKRHAPGSEDPNAGTTGGTISQTSDAGGACH